MMLQISDEEKEFLLHLLQSRHGELRSEVRHSVISSYKDELKNLEKLVEGLIEKLEDRPTE